MRRITPYSPHTMMRMFIWALDDWPNFAKDCSILLEPLAAARLAQGRLLGNMSRLGFDLKLETQLGALTEEVIMSSEIEGEVFNRESVRSSLARRLGVPNAAVAPEDDRTEGIVSVMLDATEGYGIPLTKERLFGWHAALFPTGKSGFHTITIGAWRTDSAGPMQVVSGPAGRQTVHYEAPPARRLEQEMDRFITWFNSPNEMDGLIRAAMAHLWFVTIHPFDDGNGRIARAIADMALTQCEGSAQRFYSMSRQIRKERAAYYMILEQSQNGTLDVTPWLGWFVGCFTRAVEGAGEINAGVLRKAEFWQQHREAPLNDRQRQMVNQFLDGLKGNLTARKWAIIGKCSAATAQRDIADLVERGILRKHPGGSKNTSYEVAEKIRDRSVVGGRRKPAVV